MIGVLSKGSKNFCLTGIDSLLLRREAIPFGNTVWHLGHLSPFGNNPCLDLILEIALSKNIPTLIKLAFVFGNPLRTHMMRGVRTC